MSILINTAISALDTPSSLLPFFVKDSFDVTGRTIMADNEGGKHEAREKFIEEAGTSLFWIGGIPAIRAIGNRIVKGKIDTDIDFKRINSDGIQGYFANQTGKFTDKDLQDIVLGGEKLDAIKNKLSNSGFVPNGSKGKYKNYHVGISTASVLINLAILSVAIPKFNQYLSRKIISQEINEKNKKSADKFENSKNQAAEPEFGSFNKVGMDQFSKNTKAENQVQSKKLSFGSLSSLKELLDFKNMFNFTHIAENAQLNVQSSMLLLDYGISGSRVTFVPRDNDERVEYAVKEGGIIVFFYYAADLIKSGLAKVANKILKTPIDLDYKVINNQDFLNTLKGPHDKKEFLKFVELEKDDKNAELKIIRFIDQELAKAPKNENCSKEEIFKNFTLKTALEEDLIKVEYDKKLDRWIRDSKKYIKTDKLVELNNHLGTFYDSIIEKTKGNKTTIEKVISSTKKVKMASIVTNLGICCASLSYFLPKLQYMIREHRTQTNRAPGIKLYEELAEKNELEV